METKINVKIMNNSVSRVRKLLNRTPIQSCQVDYFYTVSIIMYKYSFIPIAACFVCKFV